MKTTKLLTTRNIILSALFTALIAVGAFIRIPLPILPFTLQVPFTILAGLILGPKLGSMSVLTYIILGLMGVPIFTQGGGIGYVLKPSFGYIIGFCVAAFVIGKISRAVPNPSYVRLVLANMAGIAVVYLCGMTYYYFIANYVINSPMSVWAVVWYCCLMTITTDIIHCFWTAIIAKRLIPHMNKGKI